MIRTTAIELAEVAGRARYYAREGVSCCGTCGAVEPEASPAFSSRMPCGHPWSVLVWRRKPTEKQEGAVRR